MTKCIEECCKKRPFYNFDGETKGLYCSPHKKSDMINVISPTCIEEVCKKIPNYNYDGEIKGLY